MTGKHHLISGTVAGACLGASIMLSSNPDYFIAGGAVLTTMLGSLFPDIDSNTSKLGSKMKITSTIISKLFGHRGFLHSPLFVLLITFLLNYIFVKNGLNTYIPLWCGFVFGMINHLVCDIVTKGGIPLLYPFQRWKFSLTWMKSGSKWEFIPLILICLASIILSLLFISNGTFLPF